MSGLAVQRKHARNETEYHRQTPVQQRQACVPKSASSPQNQTAAQRPLPQLGGARSPEKRAPVQLRRARAPRKSAPAEALVPTKPPAIRSKCTRARTTLITTHACSRHAYRQALLKARSPALIRQAQAVAAMKPETIQAWFYRERQTQMIG